MKTKNNYPALVTNRHKKSTGFTLSIICFEALTKPEQLIIEQQPAPIRLYFQFPSNATYTI